MQATELLRSQFNQVHQFLDMTIGDCTQEVLDHKEDGWTIEPIGALYAHIAAAEDSIVNGLVRGTTPVLMRDGWSEKTGITNPQEHLGSDYKANMPVLKAYAAAVFKETDDFLANATEAELTKEVDTPLGKMPAITFLANIGLTHCPGHWGEIAALKGVQGLKGLPF